MGALRRGAGCCPERRRGAFANRRQLLLADEPTGTLDVETSETVFALLLRLARQEGLAAIIATHDPALAARMDRIVRLEGGRLV